MTTTGLELGYRGMSVAITGVASGIGEATAQLLGELGADVIGLDIATPQVDLRRFIPFDLRDEDSIVSRGRLCRRAARRALPLRGTTADRSRPRRAADRLRRPPRAHRTPSPFAHAGVARSRVSRPRRRTPGRPSSSASASSSTSRPSPLLRPGVAATSAPTARTTPWPRGRSAPTRRSGVSPSPTRASASTASVPARRRPR